MARKTCTRIALVMLCTLLTPGHALGDPSPEPPLPAAPANSAAPAPAPAAAAPELPASVYRARRQRLLDRLGRCAALLPSQRPDDAGVDAGFRWLTGIDQPGPVLLLSPRQIDSQVLLVPIAAAGAWALDAHAREDLRLRLAMDKIGAWNGRDSEDFARALRQSRCQAMLRPATTAQSAGSEERADVYLRTYDAHVEQRWQAFEQLRAVKEEVELERMARAAAALVEVHHEVASRLGPGQSAGARQALVDQAIGARPALRRVSSARSDDGAGRAAPDSGAPGVGPDAVDQAAAGARPDELVVVDISVTYGGYAARALRTYPVSGRFSPVQARVHGAVETAHELAISALRSGVSLARVQAMARRSLEQANLPAADAVPQVDAHFIGLEVRDVGDVDAGLDAGMVVVIETGVSVHERFEVRMADTVVVTSRAQRVLTKALPRTLSGITAWQKSVPGR